MGETEEDAGDGEDGEEVMIEDGSAQDDEEVEEGVTAKAISKPVLPSKREDAEHEFTHCPYRSWCAHCVRAKSVSDKHLAKTKERAEEMEAGAITTISMD